MSNAVVCTVEEAVQLLKHLNREDVVILTVLNKTTHVHSKPKRIKKEKGEELIKRASSVFYQDNDFFGRLSLYGVCKEKDDINNILFPQLE